MKKALIRVAFEKSTDYRKKLELIKEYPSHCADPIHHKRLIDRIHIIDHWMNCLKAEELYAIERHLIGKKSWKEIMDEHADTVGKSNALNSRTFQRHQQQGLERIEYMMNESFGDSFDYLFQDN